MAIEWLPDGSYINEAGVRFYPPPGQRNWGAQQPQQAPQRDHYAEQAAQMNAQLQAEANRQNELAMQESRNQPQIAAVLQRSTQAAAERQLDYARMDEQGRQFDRSQQQRNYEFNEQGRQGAYEFDRTANMRDQQFLDTQAQQRLLNDVDTHNKDYFQQQQFGQQSALQQQQFGQQVAMAEKQAQLHDWLSQQDLSNKEVARLQKMKSQIGDTMANPGLSDDEKTDIVTRLQTGISPLEERQKQSESRAKQQHLDEQNKLLQTQNAQIQVMMQKDAEGWGSQFSKNSHKLEDGSYVFMDSKGNPHHIKSAGQSNDLAEWVTKWVDSHENTETGARPSWDQGVREYYKMRSAIGLPGPQNRAVSTGGQDGGMMPAPHAPGRIIPGVNDAASFMPQAPAGAGPDSIDQAIASGQMQAPQAGPPTPQQAPQPQPAPMPQPMRPPVAEPTWGKAGFSQRKAQAFDKDMKDANHRASEDAKDAGLKRGTPEFQHLFNTSQIEHVSEVKLEHDPFAGPPTKEKIKQAYEDYQKITLHFFTPGPDGTKPVMGAKTREYLDRIDRFINEAEPREPKPPGPKLPTNLPALEAEQKRLDEIIARKEKEEEDKKFKARWGFDNKYIGNLK